MDVLACPRDSAFCMLSDVGGNLLGAFEIGRSSETLDLIQRLLHDIKMNFLIAQRFDERGNCIGSQRAKSPQGVDGLGRRCAAIFGPVTLRIIEQSKRK